MNIQVYIEPHERLEALEAYRQWLTPELENEIMNAPESAIIRLVRTEHATSVLVIPEG
jgi:hypothetical protein